MFAYLAVGVALGLSSGAPLTLEGVRGRERCLTPDLMRQARPMRLVLTDEPGRQVTAKTPHESFGPIPNELLSENFSVKWGNDRTFPIEQVQAMLDMFEVSWDHEINVMGHPAPLTSSQYLFNIYIGDTGDGAPSALGAGGYFYYDDNGYPMIVVADSSLDDLDYFGATVVAHEFYHAVQDATGPRYDYDEVAGWYLEATAEWITGEVFPTNTFFGGFVFGLSLLPDLSLNFFDYPDQGKLQEYHHYGAFIFPRYLTEHVADWTLIRDSWTDAGPENDPLLVLGRLLADRGEDFNQAFGDFAAHNATWDYAHHETYKTYTDYLAAQYPGEAHPIAVEVSRTGSGGRASVPIILAPQRLGYNIIKMPFPADNKLTVEFFGDANGNFGGSADFRVTVVRDSGDATSYAPLELDDALYGSVSFTDAASSEAIYLVVAAVPASYTATERFGYDYKFSATAAPVSTNPGNTTPRRRANRDEGCQAAPSNLLLAVLGAGLLLRRRVFTRR